MTSSLTDKKAQDAAARATTAVVVKYDPDHSLLHPLNASFLNDIGQKYLEASQRSGWTETWMAVYNECVRSAPPQAQQKLRFGFKGKNQLPLFMVWREFWQNGEVVHGAVLFNSMDWIGI